MIIFPHPSRQGLNEEIAERMFTVNEETNKLPPEEWASLGSFAVPDERVAPGTTYSYRIVALESSFQAAEWLEQYGAEGYRVVKVLGPHRNTLLLEKVNRGYENEEA